MAAVEVGLGGVIRWYAGTFQTSSTKGIGRGMAYQYAAVIHHQHHCTVTAYIEIAVERGKVFQINRRNHDTTEAAIRHVYPSRYSQDQVAGFSICGRSIYVSPQTLVRLVEAKYVLSLLVLPGFGN